MPNFLPLPAAADSHRGLRVAGTALLALAILAWLWSSLAVIANYHFAYPAFDQFRLYHFYLGLPFPQNALQLENGHRPILPALVRLAEIRWFSANQVLQTVVGTCAAAASLAAIAWTIARDRDMPTTARAALCLLATIALFWLGNARMLMHGNESVHAYFVVLFCVFGVLAVVAARHGSTTFRAAVAGLCCVAASFSFGTGMASFGAVLLVGIVLRLRLRALAIPSVLLVLSLGVYAFGLPGSNGVRHSLLLDPVGNLTTLTRWLSAPWMRAWLGHGDPSIEAWLQSSMDRTTFGHGLVSSARMLSLPFGAHPAMVISILVGTLGVCGFAWACLHAWRTHGQLSSSRALGLGLAAFGLGAAIIICFARVNLFQAAPAQVFADRYLPWSCLFWLGLAIYAIAGINFAARRRQMAVVIASLLVSLIFFPSHRSLAGWSATVSRHIDQSAVAAQLGIWDPRRFEDPSATIEDVEATLRLLRERHLSMFGESAYALIEHDWHAPASLPEPLASAWTRVAREFDDPHSGRHIADFEGWMPRIEGAHHPVLAVVDDRGILRGLAQPSFIGPGKKSLRFNIARKRGFDGYVLDAQAGEQLQVLVLDDQAKRVLASIPLQIPQKAKDQM